MPRIQTPETAQPRPRKPTLSDIAQLSGFSLNAISDILNRGRARHYRPETVEKVTRIARELNYRPNRASQMLLTNRSQTIGFVTMGLSPGNTVANHVVYPFVIGANSAFSHHGYHVVLVNISETRSDTGESRLPRLLEDQFCDGLILQKGRWGDLRNWIDGCQFPIILWDSGIFLDHNCIYRDEYQVGWMLTKKLISLGHKKICYVGQSQEWLRLQTADAAQALGDRIRAHGTSGMDLSGEELHYSSVLRYQGCLAAMKEHALPLDVILRGLVPELVAQLKEKSPTALIFESGVHVDPMIAHAADTLGWSIPKDLTVVSCDVDPKTAHDAFIPAVGGMVYDRYLVGGMAAEMMFRSLAQLDGKVPSIKLVGEFIPGVSTAEAPVR